MLRKKLPLSKRWALGLWRRYRHDQAALHQLTYLFWECTLRCNLNCLHCGSDCRVDAPRPDMPLGDFLRVLDEVKERYAPRTVTLALTGGEPLLRPDLDECGKEFHRRGFPWGIVSNGYVLTPERLEGLMRCGLGSVTVSLDGMEASHNWLRCRRDSFARAVEAIGLVAGTKALACDVVTCVNRRNIGELEAIKRLLIEQGMRRWRLFTIFPKGRAVSNPLLDIGGGGLRGVLEFIKATRADGAIDVCFSCEGFVGPYEGQVRDNLFWCHAGADIASVLADGSISACPSLRGDYIQGTIYKDSFLECWENRFGIMRDRSWTRTGACEQCDAYTWCEGNGLHLRDEKTGALLRCHVRMLDADSTGAGT